MKPTETGKGGLGSLSSTKLTAARWRQTLARRRAVVRSADADALRGLLDRQAAAFDELGVMFDRLCAAACPDCPKVCCLRISRRSLIDDADWLYLAHLQRTRPAALADPLPVDSGCPFLGATGCVLAWPARPYGCAHYVCERLATRMSPQETARVGRILEDTARLRGQIRNAYLETLA